MQPSNWKIWYSFSYGYYRLEHEYAYFIQDNVGSLFHWFTGDAVVKGNNFTMEGALLIPVAGMYVQIGGGQIYSTQYDNDER